MKSQNKIKIQHKKKTYSRKIKMCIKTVEIYMAKKNIILVKEKKKRKKK